MYCSDKRLFVLHHTPTYYDQILSIERTAVFGFHYMYLDGPWSWRSAVARRFVEHGPTPLGMLGVSKEIEKHNRAFA